MGNMRHYTTNSDIDDRIKETLGRLASTILMDACNRSDTGEHQPMTALELHNTIFKFIEEEKEKKQDIENKEKEGEEKEDKEEEKGIDIIRP